MTNQPAEQGNHQERIASRARKVARKFLGPLLRPVRRVFRIVAWTFPAIGNLLLPASQSRKRVLAIYDTSCQPFSVGDILVMQEATLVLCERHRLEAVDFIFFCDPKRPASSDPAFSSINESNALYHLASVLPIAQVNQRLGSLLFFDSRPALQRFIADNADRYYIWPSGWDFASRDYLFDAVFNDLLYTHYKERGTIPHLTCRPFLVDWTNIFFRKHVFPLVPVTVNIRNNKNFHQRRNLHLESWLEFFRYCETKYPVKFIIICARSEVDERLYQCPNVLIAKDHYTSIEQDLALIHGAPIHMGADSGPIAMVLFSDKPYLIVNTFIGSDYFARPDMFVDEGAGHRRFWFAGPLQRYTVGVETAEILKSEFARMWQSIDISDWRERSEDNPVPGGELRTWLR